MPTCFPMWLFQFTSSSAVYKNSTYLTSLPGLGMSSLFNFRHSSNRIVVSHVDSFCNSLLSSPTATLISSHHSSVWTTIVPNWSLCFQFNLKISISPFSDYFLIAPFVGSSFTILLQYCCLLKGFGSPYSRYDCFVFLISIKVQWFRTWGCFVAIHLCPTTLPILRYA